MPEINQSSEGLKIPENWKFRERNVPGIEVDDIDLDQRFIAINLLDVQSREYGDEKYADYFFDSEGKETLFRKIRVTGWVPPGDEEKRDRNLFQREIFLSRAEGILFYDIRGNRRLIESNRGLVNVHLDSPGEDPFNVVSYEGQRLEYIESYAFAEDPGREDLEKRGYIKSRIFSIKKVNGQLEFDPELELEEESPTGLQFQPQNIPNSAIYLDENGKETFRIDWKINDEGSLIVSQTHVPTGIIKTLSAPLRIDTKKVADAVFARSPYPRDDKGRIVVPWRNIDRIVGASISYSYPPQKQ